MIRTFLGDAISDALSRPIWSVLRHHQLREADRRDRGERCRGVPAEHIAFGPRAKTKMPVNDPKSLAGSDIFVNARLKAEAVAKIDTKSSGTAGG
jgi:hypothetical protein